MARRYFLDDLPSPGGHVLVGEVGHHLGSVLRVRQGDEVLLADGKGRQCRAVVERAGGGKVALRVEPTVAVDRSPFALHVAFAPPKWTRADWLLEHGTEVGIDTFWPLWTERTRPQGHRHDRWLSVVRAAAGQCDRAWLPTVQPVSEFTAFVQRTDLPPLRFLAAGGAAPAPAELRGSAVLLVGPEGGFTDDEAAQAMAHGFVPIGLGPHVLRTETAALVGAAMLQIAATRSAGTPPPRS